MNERSPGRWPVDQRTDLDALEGVPSTQTPEADELYVQRQKERALHEMVMDSIAHDLEQQPSSVCVLTAARSWCSRITAAAEDIARAKRKAA